MSPFFLLNFSDLDTALKLRGHFRPKHFIKQGLLICLKLYDVMLRIFEIFLCKCVTM